MKSAILAATLFVLVPAAAHAVTVDPATASYQAQLKAGIHTLDQGNTSTTLPYSANVAQPSSGGSYLVSFHNGGGATYSQVDFDSTVASYTAPYADTASTLLTYYFTVLGPAATVPFLLNAYAIVPDPVTTGDVLRTASAGLSVQCDSGANAACATPFFSSASLTDGMTYAAGTVLTGEQYAVQLSTAVSLSAPAKAGSGSARALLETVIGLDARYAGASDYTLVLSDGFNAGTPAPPPELPEPGAASVLMVGLGVLGLLRKKAVPL